MHFSLNSSNRIRIINEKTIRIAITRCTICTITVNFFANLVKIRFNLIYYMLIYRVRGLLPTQNTLWNLATDKFGWAKNESVGVNYM